MKNIWKEKIKVHISLYLYSYAVIECIMSRKSVRQFENREVGNDTIEKILKAGMAAPTAINSQPWKFVVLRDKNLLKTLADTMPNTRTQTATVAIVVCGDFDEEQLTKEITEKLNFKENFKRFFCL